MYMVSCDIDEPLSKSTKDPDGTIILSMTLESSSRYIGNSYIEFWFDESYNIDARDGGCEIVIIGPVKGISDISKKNIPKTGWTEKAAAMVGYGYIIRDRYEGSGIDPENCKYAALYVDSEIKSTTGGVLGYIIKALPLNY